MFFRRGAPEIKQDPAKHPLPTALLQEAKRTECPILADDMAGAKAVLGNLHMIFEETDVAVVRLPHRPGELGRAAARLGEKQINIDYSYGGLEPGSALALVVFGVDNLTTAASLLDELAVENA